MNPNLKKRIESINKGIIPDGYKKTKVGIVPVEWEVEHIGNHLREYRELSNDIAKYPVYSSSRKGLIPQSDYYDNKEATQTNLGYKIVPVGYVTYRHMSDDDIFHFNLNSTNQPVLVSSEYPVFNADKNTNLYFIVSCLNEMPRFRYYCRTQKLGGTRTRLYYKNLSMYQIPFPPLPEQQKIAEILSTQDKLIELHEKKVEKLKELKKAYLQKMFPQKRSKYPEIRFKGVTDAWEQRKVSDVAEIFAGGTPSTSISEYWNPKQVPWLSSGEVHKKYITYTDDKISEEGLNHSSARMIQENSVLIALAGQGKTRGTVAINRIPLSTNQSIAAMTFSSDICPEFVFSNLENRYDELRKISSGDGTRGGLNKQLVGDVLIPYTSLDEQTKIGQYFENLDTLITLHQRKLDKEKEKKKALMQLLLTGKVRVKP